MIVKLIVKVVNIIVCYIFYTNNLCYLYKISDIGVIEIQASFYRIFQFYWTAIHSILVNDVALMKKKLLSQ